MSALRGRVADLTGLTEQRIERIAGGDLSEVLLVHRADGRQLVAKSSPSVAAEAAMLRALRAAGLPSPMVEGEHDGVLMLEHVANDGVLSPNAWASVGRAVRQLHNQHGERYGWPVDYAFGSVSLPNRQRQDWPGFWAEQQLISTASILDKPWRQRAERAAARMDQLLPRAPAASLLHGDLWAGNILVREGELAAFIDPACYYGHGEVDLAMLCLFGSPPEAFWEAYGPLEEGWEERRHVYQLFPALVHMRLFGSTYAGLLDRLLASIGD